MPKHEFSSMRSDFSASPELSSAHASLPLNIEPATGIGSRSVENSSVYRKEALVQKSFVITDTMTNATFAEELCAALAGAVYDDLVIGNGLNRNLALPACVGTSGGGNVRSFTSRSLVIENWSHFPPTLTLLACQRCRFGKGEGAATSTDGWDSSGMVSWSEVFAHLPNIGVIILSQAVLPAALPLTLPATISRFEAESTGLTGTISSTFLSPSSVTSLSLILSGNKLTGSIPPNLFAPLQSNSVIRVLLVLLHNNNLNGSLPGGLLEPLAGINAATFYLRLDGNRALSGTIPSELVFSSGLGTSNFDFRLDNTNISGRIPEGFFSRYADTGTFRFSIGGSKITGPLPENLFGPNWNPVGFTALDFGNSKLNGTIPPGFISGNLHTNKSFSRLDIWLHNNDLEGTIPPDLLWNEVASTKKDSNSVLETSSNMVVSQSSTRVALQVLDMLDLRLDGNRLTGSIPSDLLSETFLLPVAKFARAVVDVSGNSLTGTIPQQIFSFSAINYVTINAQFNQLSGSLPPCTETTPIFSLDLQNNTLSGSIPTSWNQCKLSSLNLDSNVGLVGSIPSDLLNTTDLKVFRAANTSLEGELPSISTTLTTLILTKTNIDFCSPSSLSSISGFALPSRSCEVSGTSACECVASYTPCSPSLNDTCPLLEPSSPTASPSPSPSPAVVSPATTPEPASNVPAGAPTSSPSMTPQNAPSSSPIIPTVPTSSPSSVTPQTAPSSSPNVPNFPPAINTPQSSPSSPSMPTAPPGVPSSQPTSAPSGMTPQNSPSSPNMPSGPNSPPSMPPSSSPIIPAVPSSSPSGISPHSAPDSSPIVSTVPGYSPSVITPPNEPSSSPVIPAVPSSTPSGMTPHNAPSSSPGMSSSPNSPSSTTPQITPTTDSVDNPTSSSTPITASLLLLVHCAVIWMIFM